MVWDKRLDPSIGFPIGLRYVPQIEDRGKGVPVEKL